MAAGLRCVDKFRAHTSSDHDMVVMGQACKLCDDPLKSLEINQGSLLVPWFGDKGLMIDRYDCRGYLADISVYDTDHVLRRAPSLSIEEQDIEKLCDYERYLELREDLPENVSEEGEYVAHKALSA
ncbi:unnamed protein product [Protopolystoma xenopodis]|uniref:Suppressor of white apricot N-terminal domain-containing protein n=1 Tax=Protopolystoma xenopodis TaxID=117903 RepID=A0A3S5ABY8_9PLAT|nr:unnamed protein product [Protopolystoma xenopodis]